MLLPRKRICFLLVEDDSNDILLAQRALGAGHSCRVEVARDGQEAVDYLQQGSSSLPDVIILDLKLPRMSGFEFLRWLRSEAPEPMRLLPVIILSSSDLQSDVRTAYALGANAFLVKPIDASLFEERLKVLGILWSAHVELPKPA